MPSETLAALVAYSTYGFLDWQTGSQLKLPCLALIASCLFTLAVMEYVANLQSSASGPTYHNWKLRRFCNHGLYCIPLLPHAILVTVLSQAVNLEDSYRQWQVVCAVTLLVSSTASLVLMSCGVGQWSLQVATSLIVSVMVTAFVTNGLGISDGLYGFCLVWCISVVMVTFLLLLPRVMPLAFSVGEAAIVSQAVTYLLFTAASLCLSKNEVLMADSLYLSSIPLHVGFLQVVVISCGLVVAGLYLVVPARCSLGFYSLLFSIITCFSTPILWLLLKQNFVSWLLGFITSSKQKAYMFLYWATCSLGASALVWYHNHNLKTFESTEQENTSQNRDHLTKNNKLEHKSPQKALLCSPPRKDAQKQVQSSLSIVTRKHFHILAIVTFFPGIALDCQMANMAGTCAIVVFAMLECQRLLSVWPYGEVLGRSLQLFVDSRDEGPVIVTHMYLMAGCVLPLWLTTSCARLQAALFSGLLSLGVGDTAAAVVGSKFGTHPWPASKKTLEGTAAAVFAQLFSLYLLYMTGYIEIAWRAGVVAVTLTSLLEAFTSQIDNLILPLYMYTVLACS